METNAKSLSIFSEAKLSLRLAIPLIASNLVQISSSFLGTLMVARLGRDALAASALGSAIYVTLIVFFFGILSAVSILVSQDFGAKNNSGINLAVTQGFILSIVITIPMVIIMLVSPLILSLTEHNLHIINLATRYLHALILCAFPLACLIIMEQFLIGIYKTRLVLWISIIQVPFEILATYMFVFGKLGAPKLGVSGIGVGFAIVFTLATVAIALFIHNSKSCRKYNVFANLFKFNGKYFWELIRVGWPIGCMNVIEVALMAVLALIMGTIDSNQLAAYQIARQFWVTAMMIIFAISQVATIRVGQAVGADDKPAAKLTTWVNTWLSTAVMLIIAVLYIIFSHKLIGIDLNVHNPKLFPVVHYAGIFIRLISICLIIDSVRFVAIGSLRGLKDTKVPMFISLATFWLIALPIAYLLAILLQFAGVGLWLGLIVGIICGAIILVVRCKRLLDHTVFADLLL